MLGEGGDPDLIAEGEVEGAVRAEGEGGGRSLGHVFVELRAVLTLEGQAQAEVVNGLPQWVEHVDRGVGRGGEGDFGELGPGEGRAALGACAGVSERGGIGASRGLDVKAEGAEGDMSVFVQKIEFAPIDGEVNHVGHGRNVGVEKEAGAGAEFVVVAVVNPDGVGLRVEDVEGVLVEGEGDGVAPIAIGGEEGDGDRGVGFVEAVNEDAISIHAQDLGVEVVDRGQDGDVNEGADDEAFVGEGATAEGLVGFVAASALPDADDVAAFAVEEVEVVGGGGNAGDGDLGGQGGGEDGDKGEAGGGVQLVEGGLGFEADGGGLGGGFVLFGEGEAGKGGFPGGAGGEGVGLFLRFLTGGFGALEVGGVLAG